MSKDYSLDFNEIENPIYATVITNEDEKVMYACNPKVMFNKKLQKRFRKECNIRSILEWADTFKGSNWIYPTCEVNLNRKDWFWVDDYYSNDYEPEIREFLHKLSAAHLKAKGNGFIPKLVADFINSCYKNGIEFEIKTK